MPMWGGGAPYGMPGRGAPGGQLMAATGLRARASGTGQPNPLVAKWHSQPRPATTA